MGSSDKSNAAMTILSPSLKKCAAPPFRPITPRGPEKARVVVELGVRGAAGELDRARMGAIVFADEGKRQLLNSIVHPLVIEAQDSWLAEKERENPRGVAVIDAALMIESGGYKRFTKLIVVWCEPEIQLQRLMLRNSLSEEEARKRIRAQMPQEEKKRYADFLIDTSEGFESARQQTIEVFEQLKLFAEKGNFNAETQRRRDF